MSWEDEDHEIAFRQLEDGSWVPADWPCEETLYREDAEREDQVNKLLNSLRDE